MKCGFEEAQSAFRDLNARLFDDPEHSEEEDRFVLIGLSCGHVGAADWKCITHMFRLATSPQV